MTKNSRQKFKYLKNKKSFGNKIKSVFHLFKELSLKQQNICFRWLESDFRINFNGTLKHSLTVREIYNQQHLSKRTYR